MKLRIGIIIPIACMLLVGGARTFSALAVQDDAAQAARARWQHLALTHDDANIGNDQELHQRIVRQGDEGWELVGVSNVLKEGTTEKTIFYFKRPK